MLLHESQRTIAEDLHRFRVLRCGRRFGKTTLICEEAKGIAISRPSRIAYIANNYGQAREIMWEMAKKEFAGAIKETNEARLEIRTRTQQGGETYFVLRGWESIENLRGQAFDFLAIDEVATMSDFWVNWREVLRPTLTDRKGSAMFTSTPHGYNHYFDLCNAELTDNDFKTFHFTTYDNPFIPVDEIEKAKQTLPPDVFAQEYLAEFTKTSGLVYKEFSREKHLYEDLPDGMYKKLAGIDFGFTNPAAVLHIYEKNDTFYIDDEWYKRERTDAQIAEYVAGEKFDAVYPDPESAGGIEELRRRNVNVREVAKGKGSVIAGINRVRECLLNNRLFVNKRCVNTIAEFEMYSYDDEKAERDQDENPIKANDHAMDAAKYCIMTLEKSQGSGVNVFVPQWAGYNKLETPATKREPTQHAPFIGRRR